MTILWIILIIVVAIIIYFFFEYNTLIRSRNKVEEAFSTMDVYLKRRWDMIPNLVEIVKGYATHESQTLEEIAKLRTGSYNDFNDSQKVDVNQKLSEGITKLLAIVERYPDLKANDNFKQLSSELSIVEADITNARKYYNATVRELNNEIEMFPSNLVANMFHFEKAKMFEIASEERNNVNIKF